MGYDFRRVDLSSRDFIKKFGHVVNDRACPIFRLMFRSNKLPNGNILYFDPYTPVNWIVPNLRTALRPISIALNVPP